MTGSIFKFPATLQCLKFKVPRRRQRSKRFFFLISYFYFLQVDKTKRCTSKVVDLLIKLIVWPYYASWIRRGSWRAVVSSTLCIKWHFTRLERQCIFETESQDIRILSFLLILGNYWRLMRSFFDHEPQITVSSTTPKWKIQPNTQTTIDGKDDDFIRDIISPCGVKKTDKTQAISEFAHSSPSFYECFFFFWHFLAVRGDCTASTSGEFPNIWQSKRVGIIAIKNKKTRIHF